MSDLSLQSIQLPRTFGESHCSCPRRHRVRRLRSPVHRPSCTSDISLRVRLQLLSLELTSSIMPSPSPSDSHCSDDCAPISGLHSDLRQPPVIQDVRAESDSDDDLYGGAPWRELSIPIDAWDEILDLRTDSGMLL